MLPTVMRLIILLATIFIGSNCAFIQPRTRVGQMEHDVGPIEMRIRVNPNTGDRSVYSRSQGRDWRPVDIIE